MTDTNWTRVKAHLVATGRMTEEGVTRRVTARGCPTCAAPVLAGLDGDVAARDCWVDPDPVSPLGEALALLTGRYTRALRRVGGRYQLGDRSPFAIAGTPAGTGRADVLAEHRCGAPPLPTAPSVYATRLTADYPKVTPCPF